MVMTWRKNINENDFWKWSIWLLHIENGSRINVVDRIQAIEKCHLAAEASVHVVNISYQISNTECNLAVTQMHAHERVSKV